MEFIFEDLPSTTQSTSEGGQGDPLVTEDTDYPPSREKSYSLTEIPEQHSSFSVDDISRRAQEMVEKINNRRESDLKWMDSCQEMLIEKVNEMFQQMREYMYTVYERNSAEMQMKLQELAEVLDSCTKLNTELLEASQTLASLTEGLGITQSSNQ